MDPSESFGLSPDPAGVGESDPSGFGSGRGFSLPSTSIGTRPSFASNPTRLGAEVRPILSRTSTEEYDEPIDPNAVATRNTRPVGWERSVSYGMGTKQADYGVTHPAKVKIEPTDGGTRRCAHCNRRKKRTKRNNINI